MLKHLSKTNAFYRRPSVVSKSIVFDDRQHPSPLFNVAIRSVDTLITTFKRGEGVEMSKLDIEKHTRLTKQVFFGKCLNYFCHDCY